MHWISVRQTLIEEMATHQFAPDPEPKSVMGVQESPTGVLRSPSTNPREPRREDACGDPADSTELQHWIGPVLH